MNDLHRNVLDVAIDDIILHLTDLVKDAPADEVEEFTARLKAAQELKGMTLGEVPTPPPVSWDMTKAGRDWDDVARLSEGRPAVDTFVGHGISRAWCDTTLYVDFGDTHGPFGHMQLVFRDAKQANAAYCMGLRVEVKTTAHPEQDLEP